MDMQIKVVKLEAPEDCNIILGQSHFIKTIEDLYEAIFNTVPCAKFGIAFSEASGDCLVRIEGNNDELADTCRRKDARNWMWTFIFNITKKCIPINVLQRIKSVPEVVNLFCATANPVEILIAETEQGRGIIGVIDGFKPVGIETEDDIIFRKKFLREIGYKF